MPPSCAIFRAAPMTRPLSPALLTRCEVIYSYVTRLTRETRASIEDYSELVVTYELGLVDSLRSGDFQLDGDGFHRMQRSEEHKSELQSLMRNSYAVFCLKKKNTKEEV